MESEEGKSAAGLPASSSLNGGEEAEEFDIIEHVVRPRISNTTVGSNSEAELAKTESTSQELKLAPVSSAGNSSTANAETKLPEGILDTSRRPTHQLKTSSDHSLVLDRDEISKLAEAQRFLQPPSDDQPRYKENKTSEIRDNCSLASRQECAPGAYLEAPGMERQRTSEARYSCLGVAAAAEEGDAMAMQIREDGPPTPSREYAPGAYAEAPGMERQRTSEARFSSLGVAAAAEEGDAVAEQNSQEERPATQMNAQLSVPPHSSSTGFQPHGTTDPSYRWSLANNVLALDQSNVLAVAAMVPEDQGDLPRYLPQAAEFDMDSSLRRKEKFMKQFAVKTMLAAVAFIVLLIITLVILIPNNKGANTASTREATPTAMPSQMPTSFDGYIINNLVGTLPQELYMMTSLQSLSGVFNSLKGEISTYIGQLTALHGLAFSDIKGTGAIPSEVGLLTNLQVFQCRNCGFQGHIPMDIWRLSNLSHLILPVHPQLQGSIPAEIGRLSMLTFLILDRCNLSGSIPSEIGQLRKLDLFTMNSNRFTGTLPTEIGLLANIRLLTPMLNLLHGTIPSELGQLTLLTTLTLRGNKFHGTVPSELGLLTNLTITLNLSGNSLSGTIPTELGVLSRLQELEFQGNWLLSGQIPSELGQLSSVGHLTFANNSISGTVPFELSALRSILHTLTLEGNPLLSGTIPEAVCNINGTCVGNAWDECDMIQGLSLDCTSLLCGCECPCKNSTNP
ncbi:STYKc [Seminavis robusta]|uniref:STYKc n=1 Tax=Seminavis robusta TaxID=568900 RepID=A0A9N8DTD0_9STRA|nr:STYKc [Seminavis robusta]|eukprot:Sro337_g120550.1 STYKc (736) ;mRNA; f:20074-22720